MKTTKKSAISKSLHKWIGLPVAILVLVFCVSGVILNHRALFSSCDVTRSVLPSNYHIRDYNNSIIKGTLSIDSIRMLAFGNSGVWLTDRKFSNWEDFNAGLPDGADNRNIRNIVRTKDGKLWGAVQFGIFRHDGSKWVSIPLPHCHERVSDITLGKDSTSVIALTRSAVYPMRNGKFFRVELKAPKDYHPQVTMFKILWMLHSGELFGLPGRIIVDIISIILIFLCITGIILFILPYSIRKANPMKRIGKAKIFKWNFRWHDKIGAVTILLTIIIAFTGMCLRPPLMIPFVIAKVSPLPGSTLDSRNVWQDKLRSIRLDSTSENWLISTSEGFIRADESFTSAPELINPGNLPPVSPMGINVFESVGPNDWLVGSFSGMFRWNSATNTVTDYFTGKTYTPEKSMRPPADHLISGYSSDLECGDVTFDYAKGMSRDIPMPEILKHQPMSLWNVALELHVGRCYSPLIGPLSSLFVFLSGALLITVLLTGWILHHRKKKQLNK